MNTIAIYYLYLIYICIVDKGIRVFEPSRSSDILFLDKTKKNPYIFLYRGYLLYMVIYYSHLMKHLLCY